MNTKTVIFDLRNLPDAQLAASRVAGLSVLDRTMLALQRMDGDGRGAPFYGQAILLVPAEEMTGINKAVGRIPRIKMDLCWIEDDSTNLDLVLESGALGTGVEQVLYWPGDLTFGRFIPQLAREEAPADGALIATGDSGLSLLSMEAVKRHRGEGVPELLEALDGEGKVEREELELEALRLREPGDTRRAEAALMVSLRKPVDGVVAKYDRYISLAISRQLMKLPVSPSTITVLAGVVGIICGLVAAGGTYWTLLLGAVLFQVNSILDGVDGEIARAKLLESRAGQWLDTITDDLSNVAFFAGASVGCWRYYDSQLYLVVGVVIIVAFLLDIGLQYHHLLANYGTGDLSKYTMPWEDQPGTEGETKSQQAGRFSVMAKFFQNIRCVVRRDAHAFISVLWCIIGQMRIMMFFIALGAVVVLYAIVTYRYVLPYLQRRKERVAP